MSDNVTVGNATGQGNDYVIAADDDGTAQHQYVKLEFGADNTQTKVSALNPLPITGTALSGTVAVASIAAGTNTLGTIALTGALPAGSAFLGTIANAGTVAVASLVASLPAGVNTIGTVVRAGATPLGTNFIGTVANAGTVAVSSIVSPFPAGTNTIGTVALAGSLSTSGTVALTGSLPAGTNVIGTIAMTGTTKEIRSSTGTMSHVASSASVVGLLNSNSNRLGFSVENDASGDLYLGYGSNVSTTDYVVRIPAFGYFEVPFNYTGTVCGFWSTVIASDGAARIAEYS